MKYRDMILIIYVGEKPHTHADAISREGLLSHPRVMNSGAAAFCPIK